eukprot:TRINITY_DN8361_c0_g1_i1.p1 TRINITY_DN8361_c0_g1~~TRINITY_DN8361_c0_g1_i1.p1  ORF type:complete len:305 (+),score=68.58 TRINITY_DN8361_c0_g1_i1:132-1046(+)
MAFIKAQAALLQWPSVQKEYWKQLRMKELALPHPPLSDMLASPMAALRKEARQQRKYAAFLHEHSGSCEDIVTTVNESRAARRDAHSQLWREEDTIHAPDISRHFQELLSLVGNEEKDSHCQAIAKLNSIIVDESVSRRSSFQASQSNSGHAPSSHSIAQESVKTPSRSSLNPASANNAISGSKGELLSTPQRLLASNDGSNVSILSDCSYSSTDSDFTSHRAACMEFTQCEAVLFAALTSCHDGFVSFLHDNKQAAVRDLCLRLNLHILKLHGRLKSKLIDDACILLGCFGCSWAAIPPARCS